VHTFVRQTAESFLYSVTHTLQLNKSTSIKSTHRPNIHSPWHTAPQC